jgi:hypothetical protein
MVLSKGIYRKHGGSNAVGSAREARRLASLFIQAPNAEHIKLLIDQFGNWHKAYDSVRDCGRGGIEQFQLRCPCACSEQAD